MSQRNAGEGVEESEGREPIGAERHRPRLSTRRLGAAAVVVAGGVAAFAAGPAEAQSGSFYLIGSHAYYPCVAPGTINTNTRSVRSIEVSAYGSYRCHGQTAHIDGTVEVNVSGVYPYERNYGHAEGSGLQNTGRVVKSSPIDFATNASLVYSKNPYWHYTGAWSKYAT